MIDYIALAQKVHRVVHNHGLEEGARVIEEAVRGERGAENEGAARKCIEKLIGVLFMYIHGVTTKEEAFRAMDTAQELLTKMKV